MTELLRKVLRFCWCLLIFILPFKWCYTAVSAEHANFPLSGLEWLFSTILPHATLPVLAGFMLLASLLLWRDLPSLRHSSILVPLLTLSPLIFGLPGLINTTEWGYAANWYWHFYSAAAICTGIWWTSRHDNRLLPWLLNTIAVSTALTIAAGWQQRFGGQEAELRMQLEHAAETGRELPRHMIERMQQTRVSGNFSDPNVYAAHLLLTVPLLLAALCRLASRCAQPRAARWLLCSLTLFFAGGALFFSASRGAFLGLAAGAAVALWMFFASRFSKLQAVLTIAGAVLVSVLLAAAASHATSRKMETVTVRLEYYSTACRIAARFPFAGAGLGEFFTWHMRLKDSTADEARDPHSLFFAMLAQCGPVGAADALLRLGIPVLLALGWLRKRRNREQLTAICALTGWCAWNTHSLFQFNDMIIATTCYAAFIGLFALDNTPDEAAAGNGNVKRRAVPVLLGLAAIIGLCSALRFPAERRLQKLEYDLQEERISYPAALSGLKQLCHDMPTAPFPPRMACDLAAATNQPEAALPFAQMLAERTPHRSSSWMVLMRAQAACGDMQGALKSLENAAQWYPNSTNVLAARGIARLADDGTIPASALSERWRTERTAVNDDEIHINIFKTQRHNFLPYAAGIPAMLNGLKLKTADGKTAIFTMEQK